jgi:aspartyl aminopeptidase
VEPLATLLVTYMRNSEVVREFKKALVKARIRVQGLAHRSMMPGGSDGREAGAHGSR